MKDDWSGKVHIHIDYDNISNVPDFETADTVNTKIKNATQNFISSDLLGGNIDQISDSFDALHDIENVVHEDGLITQNNFESIFGSNVDSFADSLDVIKDIEDSLDLMQLKNVAPSHCNDIGTVSEIRFDTHFLYVCVAKNTWKRCSLSTW